jgi:hypothetical protein
MKIAIVADSESMAGSRNARLLRTLIAQSRLESILNKPGTVLTEDDWTLKKKGFVLRRICKPIIWSIIGSGSYIQGCPRLP